MPYHPSALCSSSNRPGSRQPLPRLRTAIGSSGAAAAADTNYTFYMVRCAVKIASCVASTSRINNINNSRLRTPPVRLPSSRFIRGFIGIATVQCPGEVSVAKSRDKLNFAGLTSQIDRCTRLHTSQSKSV